MTHEEILRQTKNALDKAIEEKNKFQEERRMLLSSFGQIADGIISALKPSLENLSDNISGLDKKIKEAISDIKIEIPKIDSPEVKLTIPEQKTPIINIPEFNIPEPKVTVNVDAPKIPEIKIPKIVVPKPEVTVNIPPFPKIPDLQWPKDKMPIEGWVQLMGVSLQNPLPVQIRDANGKPIDFGGSITQILGGGGGGKTDFFTIKGFSQSAFADYLNADGRLKVSVETGGSGLTDNELRATAVPVSQVSGAVWSNYVTGAFGSAVVDNVWNADNRLRVSLETGGSGLTDSELRAAAVPVSQVSGAMWSVSVKDAFQTTIASTLINGDDRLRVSVETGGSGLTDSELRASAIPVAQVSGAKWSTEAYQGTSPWAVSATDLDIRDLDYSTDDISAYQVSGHRWSVEATQGTSPWVVSATDLDVRDLDFAQDDISVYQVSGHRWSTSSALEAGTNAIGKLLPSDVDVTTNTNHADKYYTSAGAVTDGIIWSPAAGKRWHITTLYINVSAAATVTIEDDLVAGDVVRWKGELAANGGVVLTYSPEHPMASGEDAADLLITTSAGNVYVQAVGFEI